MWICERCVKCTGCKPQLITKYTQSGCYRERSINIDRDIEYGVTTPVLTVPDKVVRSSSVSPPAFHRFVFCKVQILFQGLILVKAPL